MPLTQILDKDLHLLKEIFENSLAPMVITDADLELPGPKFVYVNHSFEKMTGYSKEELKDQTPRILQGPKSDKAMLAKLKETLKKGEFFTGQTVNYSKNGKPYDVEWTISPIKDSTGKVKFFFSIQKDITAQELVKKQEQEIFYEQTRLAAIGEMVDAVAHQFKQPLSIINLKAQHLEFNYEMDGQITQKELNQSTKGIQKQVAHMVETIDEFRSFFVIQKETSSVTMKKLINSALVLMHDELIKNQIEVKVDIAYDEKVALFENEFKHLLLNIFNNAKDALVENKKSDRCIECNVFEEVNYIVLNICDNAGGIDEQIIDKIFQPRFTTKASDKGSGIGLYICHKIASKIGATIDVSNTQKGACFRIKIPQKG